MNTGDFYAMKCVRFPERANTDSGSEGLPSPAIEMKGIDHLNCKLPSQSNLAV